MEALVFVKTGGKVALLETLDYKAVHETPLKVSGSYRLDRQRHSLD